MNFSKETKKKNFLSRTSQKFLLAQGYEVGHGIAIVRPQLIDKDEFAFDKRWLAIDVRSGLSVSALYPTFQKCLDYLNEKTGLLDKIYQSRNTQIYTQRTMELFTEKLAWRKAGYEF